MGEYEDKLKGKANQILGDLTDDEAKRAKGELQEQKGRVKGAFEEAKVRIKDAIDKDDQNA